MSSRVRQTRCFECGTELLRHCPTTSQPDNYVPLVEFVFIADELVANRRLVLTRVTCSYMDSGSGYSVYKDVVVFTNTPWYEGFKYTNDWNQPIICENCVKEMLEVGECRPYTDQDLQSIPR